jgi:Protein of unknown function (DUF3501)
MKTEITRDDIMPMADYEPIRKERRRQITEIKKSRRIEVGPHTTFYFENYETMWHQIHEMLFIEKGGEDQIVDEIAAFNPLIPNGRELVATVMFEIDDPNRRANLLGRLGGVEETMTITIGSATDGDVIKGVPEEDVERTNAAGKASSVQFIHFPFTDAQAEKFRASGAQVVVGIGHENYAHMAVLPEANRAALAEDLA